MGVLADRHVLFERLSNLAIERAIDIMKIKIDPKVPGFEKIMARQSGIIATMMSANVRVDSSRLRKPTDDPVGKMLDQLKGLEKGVAEADTPEPEDLIPDVDDDLALFD